MRSIVIPAFNEESTLDNILTAVREFCDLVVVVNDCSDDSTSDICDRYEFVHQITNSSNRGYEYCILKGLYYCIELNASSILTFDADGQHPICEIPKAFDLIENHGFAIAIGSRSYLPRISEYFFSFYSYIFFGIWDITSGFKCYKTSVLVDYLHPGYSSVGTYFTIKFLLDGLNVMSFPICVEERVGTLSRFGLSFNAEAKIFVAFTNAIVLHLRSVFRLLTSTN